jgi:hypothetical protein
LDVETDSMLVDFAACEVDPERPEDAENTGLRHVCHRSPDLRHSVYAADASMKPQPQQLELC